VCPCCPAPGRIRRTRCRALRSACWWHGIIIACRPALAGIISQDKNRSRRIVPYFWLVLGLVKKSVALCRLRTPNRNGSITTILSD
jgi:hypothetical protein